MFRTLRSPLSFSRASATSPSASLRGSPSGTVHLASAVYYYHILLLLREWHIFSCASPSSYSTLLNRYAFAFGTTYHEQDSGEETTSTQWFIGSGGYFLQNVNPCAYPFFFFHFTLAAVAAAIACSAMGGRAKVSAYIAYTFFIMAWVYPTVAHWTWSTTAWLAQGSIDDQNRGVGYFDYAGSGVRSLAHPLLPRRSLTSLSLSLSPGCPRYWWSRRSDWGQNVGRT